MLIDITWEDIANGMRKESGRCPIALAMKRQTGGGYVSVSPCTVYTYIKQVTKLYILADNASQFVEHFDVGEIVKPQTVEIIEQVQ